MPREERGAKLADSVDAALDAEYDAAWSLCRAGEGQTELPKTRRQGRIERMSSIQRVQLAPGFVLHARPYRETSALVELFTFEHGRVAVVARGARGPKSRLRAELQPFRPLLLSWQSRSELGSLTGAESEHAAPLIGGLALYAAFYLNELLLRLLVRHDPHPVLYRDYVDALQRLEEGAPVETVLRRFEHRLLEALGYALVLDRDVRTGEALDPDSHYDYQLEQGPTRVAADTGMGFVFAGSSLLAISAGRFDDAQVLRDAKRLMRAALKLYLGDKPLKTRELLRQVMG